MTSRPWDLAEMKKYEHLLSFEQEQNQKLRRLWEVTRNADEPRAEESA